MGKGLSVMATKTLSRREMLRRSAALGALASAQLAMPAWMPRLAFARENLRGDVLVVVFLRGGADSMNIIVPFGEDFYHEVRQRIRLGRPDENSLPRDQKAINLDGFFGLNPYASLLEPIFKAGQMVAVHATGSPDTTRSHFDAMTYMERGTPGENGVGTGWLGRHLNSLDTGNTSPMRAIGWGNTLQGSLRGSINATAMQSIINYHLPGREDTAAAMLASLNALYATAPEELRLAADQTIAVTKINIAQYKPENGAYYNDGELDMALMQTAALIKADVGLEIAAIDMGGWDTHQNQTFFFNPLVYELSRGLAAFHADLGDRMKNITVVVMSEFGRRLKENASGGTDHGHGGVMFVMGGHVARKPVIADWPGLAAEQLDRGDLRITTDYRDVLSEILSVRLNNPNINAVFPGFTPTPRGVVTTE
jgi:uncharacterized protein (DUF1501 family)